jgi:glyoxylase-like metal-dependent hydrolase (beta-lactamase superfamily II)
MNPTPTCEHVVIGEYMVDRILDMVGVPFSTRDILPRASEEEVRGLAGTLDDGRESLQPDVLLLDFAGYLVRGADITLLVDAGVGNSKRRPERPAWNDRASTAFIENLERAGSSVEEVDVVVSTHLHADHLGWNTTLVDGKWVPTFPRARYLFPGSEVREVLARSEDDRGGHYGSFVDSVAPLFAAGVAQMVFSDVELAVGINLISMPGHTGGTSVVRIESNGRIGVISGDVIHHEFQLAHPEWTTRFCADGDRARAVRRELLQNVVDSDAFLFPAHFPPSQLDRQDRGFVQRKCPS